jgi:hypothetical protein
MASWLTPTTMNSRLLPPKALPPRKARSAAECEQLEQLPNIGPAIAVTGKRHDPCVLDTFMAATDFMGGAEPRPWWAYTAQRKTQFGNV